jgi:DNA invertase Pin-like site-specific DNA recombinase
MSDIVAYFRVSTKAQGRSGLGLDAQKTAVESYARQTGARIVREFREVESGKRSDRPELAKALLHSKRSKAILVVGKLDRLSRNVAFLSALMESGADFVCCDYPTANKLTIHIMASVAEAEAEAISKRTKAALQAAKAKGTLLGSDRPGHWDGEKQNGESRKQARIAGLAKARLMAAKVISKRAVDAYADLAPSMKEWRDQGLSLQAIADRLNTNGELTRRGKSWNAMGVARVLERVG